MLFAFALIWLLLILYSFSLQDLNLTLYNFPFWNPIRNFFQTLGHYRRPLSSLLFLTLISLFIYLYFYLVKANRQTKPSQKYFKLASLFIFTGILAYPMFSHDIFNYLFNAKMVWVYKANPHIQTALNYLSDPWTRFMHNIHTAAPYAYGWTLISLIPGLISLTDNFTLSFWSMKLFISLFWLGQLYILYRLVKKLYPRQLWRWWLFALSPLVLIETLIIGHNDVTMMFPALVSYWFLLKSKKLLDRQFTLALFFLVLSVGIKYATIILLPLYFIKSFRPKIDLPSWAAILLFALMFIRPGQMHSWYFIWAFSFAVLSQNRWLISLFTSLSLGAILRYLPYIYYGNWDSPVYLLRNLIWVISLFFTPFLKRLLYPSNKQ